ncbi:MAG: hypothetical protein RSE18_13635, partial [Acinetobacter sp.]
AEIMLTNGNIVKSTVANNIVDPNFDMSGWARDVPINNAQFHGCKPDGTDISTAFVDYANSLPDGATLKLPEGEYYWDATSGTKSITKNINIDATGSILNVKPNASGLPFLELKSDEVIQYSGTGILNSLSAFNPILDIKGSPLTNPCDYFVVLRSTEVLIHRAGFAEDYKKEITLDIIDNSYRLRAPSPITFSDLSKLTVRFVKKTQPTFFRGMKLKTTEVLPVDGYHLQYSYKYGLQTENVTLDMQDTNSVGVLFHFANCCALDFKLSGCIGANKDEGSSYPFLNSRSSHIKFDRCFYRDSGNAIKQGRAYIARHGNFVEFESCLFSGLDDHYGWNYFVRNMQMSKGIGFCGGSLTVENCYSSDILVNLREDTPYADGTLKIVNSFGRTHTLKAYGHTAPTAATGDFTKHKVWDVIDIDFDLYSDQMSNSAVVIKEPYTGQTDVFRSTILKISGSYTQNLNKYLPILDIWLQTNNTTGVDVLPFSGDIASKKLFSLVSIDIDHRKVIDGTTVNTVDLIRGAVSDEHYFNMKDVHFINVRGGSLEIEDSTFIDSKYANAMTVDVSEIRLNSSRFKPSAKAFWMQKVTYPNAQVYLDNVQAPNQNVLWTMFGDNIEYSKSILDDESWNSTNTWNLRNYRKGLQFEFTTVSDLIIGAGAYSSTLTFFWAQGTRQSFKVGSFYIPIGKVQLEIVNSSDFSDTTTAFRLFNTTGASVTVPAGTKIRFKVV